MTVLEEVYYLMSECTRKRQDSLNKKFGVPSGYQFTLNDIPYMERKFKKKKNLEELK